MRSNIYKDDVIIDIVIKMKQLIKRIKLPITISVKFNIIYETQSNKGQTGKSGIAWSNKGQTGKSGIAWSNKGQTEVATMPKYTQEVKDRAVDAAKEGISLAEIQRTIGPNPKATQRYLAKVGINYADLRKELRDSGKLKEPFNTQGPKAKKNGKSSKAKVDVTEEFVIEE